MAHPVSLLFSDQFAISCGTVTVDLKARKVLLIFSRSSGEYLLPKGRKDVGEALERTATRETYEETGLKCRLLPHSLPTLATHSTKQGEVMSSDQLTSEPFAVNQRSATDGTLKIIFWYLAQADSAAIKEDGTQMEGEDFETVWVDKDKSVGTLTFEIDRAIVNRAFKKVFRKGVEV